jgi:hypothetical protein
MMSFDSKTGQSAGRKGGKQSAVRRWGGKDPASKRDKSMRLSISGDELSMIDAKAITDGISRTELIVRAVRVYQSVKNTRE